MKDLITEARELIEALHAGAYDDEYIGTGAYLMLDELCDVLENTEKQLQEQFDKTGAWLEEYNEMKIALEKAQEQNKQLMHEVCKLACESVERDKALARLEAEVMAARDSMCWISVTERLPQIDVAVLVLHTYQRDEYSPITIGRLYQPCDKRRKPYWTFVSIQASDGAVYNDGTDFICPGSEYVTHWQPLPAPPEEGAEHE